MAQSKQKTATETGDSGRRKQSTIPPASYAAERYSACACVHISETHVNQRKARVRGSRQSSRTHDTNTQIIHEKTEAKAQYSAQQSTAQQNSRAETEQQQSADKRKKKTVK